MQKILILYKSKYGATKKYVDMLCQNLTPPDYQCTATDTRNYRQLNLGEYDWIIFAGGLYARSIAGIDILRDNYQYFAKKNIIIFCVGISEFNEDFCQDIRHHNLKGPLRNIPMFYGRGEWNESVLTVKDRFLCMTMRGLVAKRDPEAIEPWMTCLLRGPEESCSYVDPSYLEAITKYIKLKNVKQRHK